MKQKLFNPFIRIAGLKAFAIGIIFLLISSALAGLFSTRFDGALDAHFGGNKIFYVPFLDNLINISILVIVFYFLGIALTKGKTRFIDILGTITLARFPMVLIPLLNIGNAMGKLGEKITNSVFQHHQIQLTAIEVTCLIVISIITLLILIWYVILLFRAYSVSTNLKGAKAIISFISGLILAEIISSILIRSIL